MVLGIVGAGGGFLLRFARIPWVLVGYSLGIAWVAAQRHSRKCQRNIEGEWANLKRSFSEWIVL